MNPHLLEWLPVLSPLATLVIVVLGVFANNRHVDVRISDLQRAMEQRFTDTTARLEAVFKLEIGKVEARVKALEERGGVIYRG